MRPTLQFNRIVVIGGGCYGRWYTQQLARAIARDALQVAEIHVVDRDPACQVAAQLAAGAFGDAPVQLVVSSWDAYLATWLAAGSTALAHDAMVPSPLMPHLALDWLIARARARTPQRTIEVHPLPVTPPTPWERAAPDARHYVSFATWTCPVNCIEPATCPATRGARDWSMPHTITAMAADLAHRDPRVRGAVIFPCVHRTYGVGMIDAITLTGADESVAQWSAEGACQVLVATVSHCHGALGMLTIA